MRSSRTVLLLLGVATLAGSDPADRGDAALAVDPALRRAVAATAAKVQFVPNLGQWDEAVRFAAIGDTHGWLHDDGFSVRFERWEPAGEQYRSRTQSGCVVRTHFLGAAVPRFAAHGVSRTRRHFLVGDESRHRTQVPAYERVVMHDVLPGIDVAFRPLAEGRRGPFEYDLLLAPGADLARFVARCEGAATLRVDAAGRLCSRLAGMPDGVELVQEAPIAWQETAAGPRPLRVAFRLLGNDCYGFVADGLDPTLPTVVDPGIVWGSFLGGGSTDGINDLAWQPGVGVWVAGFAGSTDFPITTGAFQTVGGSDAFVAQFADDGQSLLFATYLGGSSTDEARGIALGPGDAATVVGVTRSPDFPVTPGALQSVYRGGSPFLDIGDGFVTRLDANGAALAASTYFGGTYDDIVEAVAIDAAGAAVVAGWTSSHDLPMSAGALQPSLGGPMGAQSDGFVARIAADKQVLLAGTFLGGPAIEEIIGLDLDPHTGDAIVCGWTTGPGYPITPGAVGPTAPGQVDAIVSRVNAPCSALVFSTYLGGSNLDYALTVHRERTGVLWVGGSTTSPDFPTTPGAPFPTAVGGYDGFLVQLSPDGQVMPFATYVGGPGNDRLRGIATVADAVVVVGEAGPGFPLTPDGIQLVHGGGVLDGFLMRLTAGSGTWGLGYGTLLGGAGQDVLRCVEIADSSLMVIGGWTFSSDLQLVPAGFQPQVNGIQNGLVAKFDVLGDLGEGLRATSGPSEVERNVTDGERELVRATLTNLTDRTLFVDALRIFVGGAGDAPSRLAAVRCEFERPGEVAFEVSAPRAVLLDDSALELVLQGTSLPPHGQATLRVLGTVLRDPAGFSAEIAAAILDPAAWTLRAEGGGGGPQVRVEAPGRAVGPVLVLGELAGDADRDGAQTVHDVRQQLGELGAADPAIDADGDGVVTPTDVAATRELVLGRATLFEVPAVWTRGASHRLRGAFPRGSVQATLGGLALTLGTATPRELTLLVPANHPTGTQEFALTVAGRVVQNALVQVQ